MSLRRWQRQTQPRERLSFSQRWQIRLTALSAVMVLVRVYSSAYRSVLLREEFIWTLWTFASLIVKIIQLHAGMSMFCPVVRLLPPPQGNPGLSSLTCSVCVSFNEANKPEIKKGSGLVGILKGNNSPFSTLNWFWRGEKVGSSLWMLSYL